MEITKREIIASISILAIMLILGIFISDKISDRIMDKNEKYYKALKIDTKELFHYGMKTNVGNAFVYGKFSAIDSVNYPEIDGEYMYVEKVKEKYTMHTRTVTTTVNGKVKTRTETYWTWDVVGRENKKSEKISFLDKEFQSNKFDIPGEQYICTIKESSHVRYKYYGVPKEVVGTIFVRLSNNDIEGDNNTIYSEKNINETIDYLDSEFMGVLFWIIWIFITGAVIYGFYYLDNDWLE